MGDLSDLGTMLTRYSGAANLFKQFHAKVKAAAGDQYMLQGATVSDLHEGDDWFDVSIAGQWFRMSCALLRWDNARGTITCHVLDRFTRKPLPTNSSLPFNAQGEVAIAIGSESMQTAEGAARIVADLVMQHLRAEPSADAAS